MGSNAKDQRRDVSQNHFRDHSIINQGWMRDVHYHLPRLPARADGAGCDQHHLPAPHFLVPFPENKRFVGREGILRRLKDGLFDNGCARSMAIVGLGGIGKTQVALQIAYHAKTYSDWSVVWLSALSMATFEQSCAEMVERLRLRWQVRGLSRSNKSRSMDETAAGLLSFISQIEPRAVPESMLPRTGTEEGLLHAIGTLCGYAFLYRREDGKMLDMHSLVHLAAQEWVRGKGDAESVKRNVILHMATVFQSDDWENHEVWRSYIRMHSRPFKSAKKGKDGRQGGASLDIGLGDAYT